MGYDPQLSKHIPVCRSPMKCEKEEMVNIQKNFGLTAGKKVKVWPGVR